jgi:hypothetical protein
MAETAAHVVDHVIPWVKVLPGGLVYAPAALSVRFSPPAARAGLADRPPRHIDIF